MLNTLRRRLQNTGLVGPAYKGALGKLRLVKEHFVVRTEVVSVATRGAVPEETGAEREPLRLQILVDVAELEPFRAQLDAAYYPGFTAKWAAPFTWGETLILGLADEAVTTFTWVQRGTPAGFPCYYGPLLEGEARILRAGVLPAFRGHGVYARLNRAVVRQLFADGIERVYIDCYRGNVPALKSHIRSGFRPIALIRVVPAFGLGPFIRWQPLPNDLRELDRA